LLGLKIFQLHASLQYSAALIHAEGLKWQTVEMYLYKTASAERTECLCDCLTITRLGFVIPMSTDRYLCISNISPQDRPPILSMVSEIRQLNPSPTIDTLILSSLHVLGQQCVTS
jgi:hypothetical protein